jgi:hypothetical protein
MLRDVLNDNGVYYMNSLSDGSVYYIIIEGRQYKVTYTDERGYFAQAFKDYDHKGGVILFSTLKLSPIHLENLNKLKEQL